MPAIQIAEFKANELAQQNDPRSSEIYELLDQIMVSTDEIISVSSKGLIEKDEMFVYALKNIKKNLETIFKFLSDNQFRSTE